MSGIEIYLNVTFFILLSLVLGWITRDKGIVQTLILFAFLLRVILLIVDRNFNILPYTRDYTLFDNTISSIIFGWKSGILAPAPFSPSVQFFSYLMAPFYLISDYLLIVSLVSSFLGVLAIFNVFRISKLMYDKITGIKAAFIFSLYPTFIHYSTIPMRESLAILLFTEYVYLLIRWIRRKGSMVGKLSCVALGIVLLRPENLVVVLGPSLILFWWKIKKSKRKKVFYGIVLVIIIIVAIFLTKNLLFYEIPEISPENLSARRNFLSRPTKGGAYLSNVTWKSWPEVLMFIPVGGFYFLLVPLPWTVNFGNIFMVAGLLENLLLFYPIIILSIITLFKYRLSLAKEEIIFLTIIFLGVGGYGLLEGNMGPAMRHRLQFTFLFFILASPAIPKIKPFPFQDSIK